MIASGMGAPDLSFPTVPTVPTVPWSRVDLAPPAKSVKAVAPVAPVSTNSMEVELAGTASNDMGGFPADQNW